MIHEACIVTAYDEKYLKMARFCVDSIGRYASTHKLASCIGRIGREPGLSSPAGCVGENPCDPRSLSRGLSVGALDRRRCGLRAERRRHPA